MGSPKLSVLGLGGALAPILFSSVTLVGAYMRPEYSHLDNFISELGATDTPNADIMNFIGFIPSGLLFVLFAISLLLFYARTTLAKAGTILLIVFGLGMALAGIYSCDPGCPPHGSPETTIHDQISAVTFISAIFGIVLLGISFKSSTPFKKLRNYSILSGIVAAILLVIMIDSFESRALTGIWQRLLLLTIFLWTTIIGSSIYDINKDW
ncbi:DUF998 domain-containing protein [Pricia sp. S334]|uniref:DUF998 domain-containing protein n=1 Tax=Pricia mediterranea TaxID=3076079 RepID=A0ABU3L862_9FLAO|nr:DUF998 domain-containing protein [Pricia sp. S334]MDT7829501.1 DUF998 domain-containing protein [Pricia sp. S334]